MTTIPTMIATYRLQLSPGFRFDDARAIVPYLADLGISHMYLSPIFEARPASTHGYDQTDPTRIRSELGGESAFNLLADAVSREGMRILLDIVPNHMATHHANPWWFGVLKHGPGSRYDKFFDIVWDENNGRVVLPVLGASLEESLEQNHLHVVADEQLGPCIAYSDRLFPLREDRQFSTDSQSLSEVLSSQHYELAFWRDGLSRINYRRFFDIADLAGLCVERDEVFNVVHQKVFDLVATGRVHAIRLDHIDGLQDPLAYLKRLRTKLNRSAGSHVPLFVEKILADDESLPTEWPVDGTTGYEFLAGLGQLSTNATGVEVLRQRATVGRTITFRGLAAMCKEDVAKTILSPELNRVCVSIDRAMRAAGCSIPHESLRHSVVALSSHLGVYRTYADASGLSIRDAARVCRAADAARIVEHALPLLELLTLTGRFASSPNREFAIKCVLRWQQFTGPLAAKGVEDTAFYRDTPCPWLCDVGSEPHARDTGEVWGRLTAQRIAHPLTLNTSDTHDAKRSEDVRTTLAALSFYANEWNAILDEWAPLGLSKGVAASDATLLLHSMFAIYEDDPSDESLKARLKAYAIKAAREAKVHSSWLNPNANYERALESSVDCLLSERGESVRRRLTSLREAVRTRAHRNSVAQCVLKCLFPGVPDIYQGAETPVYSLADPDNRRVVNFHRRSETLKRIQHAWREKNPLVASDADTQKLFACWRSLELRRKLLANGPMRVEAFEWTHHSGQWTVSAGDARCTARVVLEEADFAPPDSNEVDQLGGMLRNGDRAWTTVVVHGSRHVW